MLRSGAIFDSDHRFRYRLWREWDSDLPRLCFVLLNPSVADADADDPTVRRCIGYSKRWGYGAIDVVNLFAFRATRPAYLRRAADPIGPANDRHIREAIESAGGVIAAWGNEGAWRDRHATVQALLPEETLCFGMTRVGQPRHPLYLAKDAIAVPLRCQSANRG